MIKHPNEHEGQQTVTDKKAFQHPPHLNELMFAVL